MLNAFTRNYADNSTEAGFQFTFYCDICNDGFKSSFVESDTYKKGQLFRGIGRGASALGGMYVTIAGTRKKVFVQTVHQDRMFILQKQELMQ